MKRIFIAGALIACGSAAQAVGFLRIEGIEGEASHAEHQGWIELDSVSSAIRIVLESSTPVHRSVHQPVVVTKRLDKASPRLAEALASDAIWSDAFLVARRGSGALLDYFEFAFRGVKPLDWATGASTDSSNSRELLRFSYEDIDWTYRLFNDGNQILEQVSVTWNVTESSGGTLKENPPAIDPVSEVSVAPGETFIVRVRISDSDTPLSDLEFSVESRTENLVEVLGVSGSGATREVELRAKPLRTGTATVSLRLRDGKNQTERSFSVLVGVEATPFEAYLSAYYNAEQLADRSLTGPLADSDSDSLTTVMEFYLGTSPTEPTRPSEAMAHVVEQLESGGVRVNLQYARRLGGEVTGSLWVSSNLGEWIQLSPGQSESPLYEETASAGQSSLYENVAATVTFASQEAAFLRLQLDGFL